MFSPKRLRIHPLRGALSRACYSTECTSAEMNVKIASRLGFLKSPLHEKHVLNWSFQRNFSSAATAFQNEENDKSTVDPPSKKASDESSETSAKRVKLSNVPISEVLKAKHALHWVEPVICKESTIRDAISTCIDRGLSGMMVVDREINSSNSTPLEKEKVVGMTTSRDLLRQMSAGLKDGEDPEKILNVKVGDFMTPLSKVIYVRPEETIGTCRAIIAKLGLKCLPILAHGRVEGLITSRDMSDYGLDAKERGGKKNFLNDISERVGLSDDTSMADPPVYIKAHLAKKHHPLFMNLGVAELPHPFKSDTGCGNNHRDYGAGELATNPSLSEDAHFIRKVAFEGANGSSTDLTYMGVADGVGSWREYGVDPREFSRKLMEECDNVLLEPVKKNCKRKMGENLNGTSPLPPPAEILARAYERVKEENIIGSCTACIAFFDGVSHQLHFSNLGDSGIVVLRHIDSGVAGALKRDRITPRLDRKSDLRVAFVSQQQLLSFNHPFQFGWTGEESGDVGKSFKTAADCCTTSIHVRRGDIIIMATDGLFDNVDVDDIAQICLEWEQEHKFIKGGDIAAREARWEMGDSMTDVSVTAIPSLAETLCKRARDLSLDKNTDSPFAILAKENDIMWSGGMPDDCTVIAMHLVGKPQFIE